MVQKGPRLRGHGARGCGGTASRRGVSRNRVTMPCVADTLTIRLDASDRKTLQAAADGQGKGLSAFVRELAEAEARRLQRAAILADGERVVAHLAEHPEARDELEMLGTPLTDLP